MRLMRILFLALFLAGFSIQFGASKSCGTNWLGNDAVGNDPDFSVSSHELGSLVRPSPDLMVPTKTETSKPRASPDEPPVQPTNLGPNQNGSVSSNQPQVTQIQHEVEPMDVTGKWLIKFNDATDRSLVLTLWPSGGARIMGYGTLTEGSSKNSITAKGSVGARELTLIAKLATPNYADQKGKEYDIDLFMVNNTLSGTYILNSDGQSLGNGNATAVKQ